MNRSREKHLLLHMALAHHKSPAPALKERLSSSKVYRSMREDIIREKEIHELKENLNQILDVLREQRDNISKEDYNRLLSKTALLSSRIRELDKKE